MKKLFQFLLPLMLCLICGIRPVSAAENITTWAQLKAAMESATEPTTIVLTQDIVATAEDKAIFPAETSIVLDLNGYTLDRNLSEPGSANNGCVFFMQRSLIDLTIKDSSPAKTGVITGGYATTCAGCIELGSGSLTLLGGTITGNKTLYYGGGIDKFPYAKLMVGGTARVTGNYAYETGIKQWNSDIHFNDNVLDGFSFATGDDALVTEGEHKAQFGIRFWTGVDIAPELWTLPSREAASCFVSNNQREKYRTSVEEDDGEFLLCLTLHDHEFDGIKCTSACELCGMVREDGIHNMKGEGCTQECSYCHIKVHSNDIYDSKGVCPQCKAHRVDDETLLDYQGVRYRLKVDSKLNAYAEVYGYADDIKESVVIPKTIATSNGVFRVASFANGCFQGCTRVKDVDIQAEVTFIANSTFSGCSNLTSVVIPNSVTEFGTLVFKECSSLASINLPDGLTTIGSFAFNGCSSLTSINLPDGLTTIGSHAFRGCSSLASINLPEGVTKIEDSTFEGCSSLASVNLPEGLTTIGDYAFMNCSALKSIVIPGSVQTIDDYAFKSTGLTSVTINQGVEEIGGYDVFSNCLSLTDVSLPASLKTIGSAMFSYCTSLTEIVIPNGVETIGKGAFRDCTSLTEVVIPDGVKFIYQNAFGKCTNLKSVTIPSSVISVELHFTPTFDGCSSDKLVINVACTEYLNEVTPTQWGNIKEINRVHDFTAEEAKGEALKSAATCLDKAVYYRSCTVCGHVHESDDDVFEYGSALGHEYTSETATAPYLKSKATCINNAVYFHKCSRCESRGATTWIKEGSALGHEWGEYHLDGDQTCTYDGHKTAECTREGCSEENKIGATGAALGHDWEDYFTTDIAATCTEAGSESRHCARCSATTDVAPIVAHGHSFTDYISNGDATIEADGTKTAVCDHGCGETDTVIDEGSRIIETPTGITNVESGHSHKAVKVIENGRVVIIRDGVRYDLAGRKM